MAEQKLRASNPDDFRAQGWWRDETLDDWLGRCVTTRGTSPAVIAAGQALTYPELSTRVAAFASGLAQIGIVAGDIVAVHLPNIPEFLIAWFAINQRGAVMQTIHMPYGLREVEHMLRHSGAKAVLALSNLRDRSPAAEIAGLALPGGAVIAVGGSAAGAESYEAIAAAGGAKPVPPHRARATDAFLQLYTSGTTAAPKAVAVTYNHFLSNARLCAAGIRLSS